MREPGSAKTGWCARASWGTDTRTRGPHKVHDYNNTLRHDRSCVPLFSPNARHRWCTSQINILRCNLQVRRIVYLTTHSLPHHKLLTALSCFDAHPRHNQRSLHRMNNPCSGIRAFTVKRRNLQIAQQKSISALYKEVYACTLLAAENRVFFHKKKRPGLHPLLPLVYSSQQENQSCGHMLTLQQ